MKIELTTSELYPLTPELPTIFNAVGHIDLYSTTGEIVATIRVDIPKCYYNKVTNELITLEDKEGVD